MLIKDDNLFIVTREGLEIMDISDPMNVHHVSALLDNDNSKAIGGKHFSIQGQYLYVVDRTNIGVIDISDLSNPSYVGGTSIAANYTQNYNIVVDGDYAYVAQSGGYNPGLTIIDISNPSSPTIITQLPGKFMRVDKKGNYIYATGDSKFKVVDVSDVHNPVLVSEVSANNHYFGGYNVIAGNKLAFTTDAPNAAIVLNITDPSNPNIITNTTDNDVWYQYIFTYQNENYLLAETSGDESNGIRLYQIHKSYPTSKPYIQPTDPVHFVYSVTSFSDVLGPNNQGQVVYQVSTDGGNTWKYWDGNNWVTTTATDGTQTSTANDINAHIAQLDTDGGDFTWRAYLVSDGTQQVELDAVSIELADVPAPTPTPLATPTPTSTPTPSATYYYIASNVNPTCTCDNTCPEQPKTVVIKGVGTPGATIIVEDANGQTCQATVAEDGTWECNADFDTSTSNLEYNVTQITPTPTVTPTQQIEQTQQSGAGCHTIAWYWWVIFAFIGAIAVLIAQSLPTTIITAILEILVWWLLDCYRYWWFPWVVLILFVLASILAYFLEKAREQYHESNRKNKNDTQQQDKANKN